ncbi:MAG: Replicative DNA helicase [Elusimicrobia bacterium]|nr:Replicative DNA helicase [Elusimicrobiota bacterium]
MAEQNETLPPHSIEAEMAVLGSMLVEREAVVKAADILKAEDFYKEAHRKIYSTILKLNSANVEADVITVSDALKSDAIFTSVAGPSIIFELAERVPTALHVEHYAKIVHEKSLLRALIQNARELIRDAHADKIPANDLVDKAQEHFFTVGQRKARRDFMSAGDLMQNAVETLEQMAESGKIVTGVPTGYIELDTMTAGLQPTNLIIVAGRPSMGKTTIVMNMAEHIAVDQKIPVVFFSLEMSHQELALRLLCSRALLNMGEVRRGYLARKNWPRITSTASDIAEAPLFFDFSTSPTVLEIRSASRRYAHDLARKGQKLGLIIIDYLQLMRGDGSQESRQQEISEISRSLKGLARELGVPVIALSQLNRKPEDRTRDGRPQLSDLRESGAIEQDADVVMAIYREEVYKRDDPDLKGKAKIFVLKQRNGPVGDVNLTFIDECTRFVNPERELEPASN